MLKALGNCSVSTRFDRFRGVLAFLIVIVPFLLTRLPFYLYYPIVTLTPDSWTYAKPAYWMLNGTLPYFDHRTPGYPLFIVLLFKLFGNPSNLTIVITQTVLSIASLLFLVYVIYKKYPDAALYAASAIAAYSTSVTFLWYESNYMSESLYVSFLMLFFSFFINAFHSKRALTWAVASCLMGYMIWIRPAGIFILLVAAATVAYQMRNRYPWKATAAFTIPCAVMLVILACYNRYTLGSFTVSPFGPHNLFSLTIPFMKPDKTFPDDVNKAIAESVVKRVSEDQRRTVMSSWDIQALNETFRTTYAYNLAITFELLKSIKPPTPNPATPLMGLYPVLNEIAMAEIKGHPLIYLKFVGVMFAYYLTNIRLEEADINGGTYIYNKIIPYSAYAVAAYQNTIRESKDALPLSDRAVIAWTLNEYLSPYPPEMKNALMFHAAADDNSSSVAVVEIRTPLMAASIIYQRCHRLIFRNIWWTAVYLIMMAYVAAALFRRRFMDREAFIVAAFLACPLISAIVTTAVTTANVRYSYPTEIGYYLPVALFPILRYHCLKMKKPAAAINKNPTT
ncbi:MAG: glycosyltransferase family 39 protein [Candidatus Magnetominusculus sp. LBB02]|nr:glycosyltransferase family 39 protein [Candidatus Magnetominusculus sp. LBB02]